MNPIGLALVWCVVQATIVSFVAMLVYALTFRGGATTRSGVALAGLLTAAALVPLAFSPWPRWDTSFAAADGAAASALRVERPAPTIDFAANESASADENASVWLAAWDAFVEGLGQPAQPVPGGNVESAATSSNRWPHIVVSLMLLTVAAGLLRLALGTRAVRRSIRQARLIVEPALLDQLDLLRAELACTARIEVRESNDLATAATAGWRKPVLLLPPDWRDWTEAQRQAVLAHELAHVRRQDYLAAFAAQAALAIHFYHPLLHWLAGRLRLEQELAADALAASVAGGRAAYLKTLAELALRRSDGRVAWPARAFLPSRRTFLRRIEMLRDPRRAVDRPTPLLRGVTIGCLLFVGVAVAGFRPVPAQDDASQPRAVAGETGAEAPDGTGFTSGAENGAFGSGAVGPDGRGFETGNLVEGADQATVSPSAYIPATAIWAAAMRPKAILDDPAIKPFTGQVEEMLADSQSPAWKTLHDAGLAPRTIESLAVGAMKRDEPDSRGIEPAAFAMQLTKAVDRAVLEKQASEKQTTFGGIIYRLGDNVFASVPAERTLLVAKDEATLTAMLIGGQINRAASPWLRIEERLGTPALAVMFDAKTVAAEVQMGLQPSSPQAAMLMPVLPMLQDTKLAGVALTLGEDSGLKGYAIADDESSAERVAETLRALVTLGKNTLRQFKEGLRNRSMHDQALAKMFLPIAETLLDSAKIESEGSDVTLKAEAGGSASVALALILPAVENAREAARQAQSKNNLKQIALAFHNYYDKHNHFPPAVIEENGVTRSWRMELLPFLEQGKLYEQYRKDEAWDSEANRKVLAQMPEVFRNPTVPPDSTNASYFVLTGPKAANRTLFFTQS